LRVIATLSETPMWPAIAVTPEGAGSRVVLAANIEPDALANSFEEHALGLLCAAKRTLEQTPSTTQMDTNKSTKEGQLS